MMAMFEDLKKYVRNLVLEETRVWYDRNPSFTEILLGLVRLVLALFMILAFILMGGSTYESINARGLAIEFRQTSPLLHLIPTDVLSFFIYIFSWNNLRFALPVVGALISVIIAGAYYVRDIYDLKQIQDALRYVFSSMFALHYPYIRIDHGEKEIPRKETNLIDTVGGPGYAQIQPGNGVLFRKLRKVSRNIITQTVLMTRFETIGPITNLDDQDGYVKEISVVSRDGIPVKIRDVRYRYRLLSETVNGKPIERSPENPYPFSHQAFIDLSYSLSVNDPELSWAEAWAQAVRIAVTGVVEDYVCSHTVDTLTAPRNHSQDPRREIRDTLFGPGITGQLRGIGTQLLWMDIGHFDIDAEEVDRERINLWAAEWQGEASIKRAESEAFRLSLQEQGRAEGQAEILREIAHALEGIDTTGNRAQSVRHMLLTRTAQILEALHDNRLKDSNKLNS